MRTGVHGGCNTLDYFEHKAAHAIGGIFFDFSNNVDDDGCSGIIFNIIRQFAHMFVITIFVKLYQTKNLDNVALFYWDLSDYIVENVNACAIVQADSERIPA